MNQKIYKIEILWRDSELTTEMYIPEKYVIGIFDALAKTMIKSILILETEVTRHESTS